MADDEQWGVVVDEVGIFATRRGMEWWVEQSVRMQSSGVLIELDHIPLAGAVYMMKCTSEDDARFAAAYMAEHIHAKFAKASTLAAARKAIRRQHAKRRKHSGCRYCREADRG